MLRQPGNAPSGRNIALASGSVFGVVATLAVLSAVFPRSGLHDWFATVCHQRPERSHWLGGEPFGLCVRCFWLYVGLALGHWRFCFWPQIPAGRRKFLLVSGALAVADWLLGWLGLFAGAAVARAITGFLFGFAVANYSLPGMLEWFSAEPEPTPNPQLNEPIRS